jgi:hypothetical protein
MNSRGPEVIHLKCSGSFGGALKEKACQILWSGFEDGFVFFYLIKKLVNTPF